MGSGLRQHPALRVPVCRSGFPVSGAAMAIKEGDEVCASSPTSRGIEGFPRRQDFKVPAREGRSPALQMDMKMSGLAVKTSARAVKPARPARCTSSRMLEATRSPVRSSRACPRLAQLRIDPELIRAR